MFARYTRHRHYLHNTHTHTSECCRETQKREHKEVDPSIDRSHTPSLRPLHLTIRERSSHDKMWKGGILPGRWLGSSTLSSSSRGETKDDRITPPNDSNIRGSAGNKCKTVRSVTRRPQLSSQRPHPRGPRHGTTATTLANKIRPPPLHHHHHRGGGGGPPQLPPQLSNNAAHALYTGRRHDDYDDDDDSGNEKGEYALEFDCEESVSSLNDSCFGGASVTGGYNIYSTEEPPEELIGSPIMKQATSLAVGRVPSTMCLPSVSDHPSFDTEDLSYFVHDVEQPTILPPVHNNNIEDCIEVECENSLINAKDGRLRTMMPILTGTLSPKPKRRSDIATSTNHLLQVRSLNPPNPPKEDATSVIISTTSSESHHGSQVIKAMASLPHTATTTTTPSSSQHDQQGRTNETSNSCGTRHCLWYRRVPFWWKVLLIAGWMLLIMALLMALIGGIVALKKNRNNKSTSDATTHANPNAFPVFATPNSTNTTFITEFPTVSPTTRHKSKKESNRRQRW